jgi:hypothetical protein
VSVALSGGAAGAAASELHTVPDVALEGVSCPSASTCWAVGFAASGAHKYQGAVVKLVGGEPRGVQYVGARTPLRGISCTGQESCIAVGEGPAEQGEVVPITGGVAGTAQNVGSPGWSLGEVSCGGPSTCWAVGDNGGTLVEIEEGRPATQRIVSGIVTFDDISCASAVSCIALGAQSLTTEVVVSIVSGEPTYGPVLGPNLDNLACPPGGACELVGNTYPRRPLHALISTLEGTHVAPARRAPGLSGLLRVSCATPQVCEAIGYAGGGGAADRAATVTIVAGAPRGPHVLAPGNDLDALACATASVCVAVGNTEKGRRGLVDVLDVGR